MAINWLMGSSERQSSEQIVLRNFLSSPQSFRFSMANAFDVGFVSKVTFTALKAAVGSYVVNAPLNEPWLDFNSDMSPFTQLGSMGPITSRLLNDSLSLSSDTVCFTFNGWRVDPWKATGERRVGGTPDRGPLFAIHNRVLSKKLRNSWVLAIPLIRANDLIRETAFSAVLRVL